MCAVKDIFEQEMHFLKIADDKIKSSVAKLQQAINGDTLRIDNLESQIRTKLESSEFK